MSRPDQQNQPECIVSISMLCYHDKKSKWRLKIMEGTVNYKELIVKDLEELPPELIQEVIDFVEFLKIKKMKKTGVDYGSLLLQQESLSRIWEAESEELYDL
jgi:hypothetical protein